MTTNDLEKKLLLKNISLDMFIGLQNYMYTGHFSEVVDTAENTGLLHIARQVSPGTGFQGISFASFFNREMSDEENRKKCDELRSENMVEIRPQKAVVHGEPPGPERKCYVTKIGSEEFLKHLSEVYIGKICMCQFSSFKGLAKNIPFGVLPYAKLFYFINYNDCIEGERRELHHLLSEPFERQISNLTMNVCHAYCELTGNAVTGEKYRRLSVIPAFTPEYLAKIKGWEKS